MAQEQQNGVFEKIPFWNVNIPPEQWTDECPDYLSQVDEFDRAHLAIRDEDYQPMTWEHVRNIVATNRLEDFKRIPSELRRYRKYMGKLKQEYGSVMNFIMQERVKWQDLTSNGSPFERPEDIKILYNDWPYGMDPEIVHLVVWTKFSFDEDPESGDLTPSCRKQIDDFVTKTFKAQDTSDQVIWFKNWSALKSVHAVEHFHVMLYNPDPELIRHLTNNDIPLSKKIREVSSTKTSGTRAGDGAA